MLFALRIRAAHSYGAKERYGMSKPVIFSGMQPTGIPTLGNYIGALRHWINLQEENRCLYCVVDLHAITVRQNPETLRGKCREMLSLYIALGLDPVKNIIYYQSHVSAHAELAWVLNCFTYVGELNRMTQFKDKSQKNADNINAGLYTYPVLQTADIVLFQTNKVPVGEDQKQHLELCRDVALRFNKVYGDIFTIPEPYIAPVGARIMSLQEPGKIMSKSEKDNEANVIRLLDAPETIMKKFKRAVTDSDSQVRYAPLEKPGVSNLLTIYACVTGSTLEGAQAAFDGAGYGTFKTAVGEAVAEMLAPVRKKYGELMAAQDYLDNIIKTNAEKAREMAAPTLQRVKEAVGFPR
jgi:tryptophanyl-tRNA synthetase